MFFSITLRAIVDVVRMAPQRRDHADVTVPPFGEVFLVGLALGLFARNLCFFTSFAFPVVRNT